MNIPGTIARVFRSGRLADAALAIAVVASVVTAACLIVLQYVPDSRTDDETRAAVVAASEGTVALLSYTPDTLDRDFAAAKTRMTGDFLTYYTQFTEQVIAPAAKERDVQTSAEVVRTAASDLRGDTATVLVFINQTTTTSDKPDPTTTASSVRVTLTKVEGAWRISSFDPV